MKCVKRANKDKTFTYEKWVGERIEWFILLDRADRTFYCTVSYQPDRTRQEMAMGLRMARMELRGTRIIENNGTIN